MKVLKIAMLTLIALGLMVPASFAGKAEDMGKKLFEDPKAFGGEKACSECHPNGRGLEKAGTKMEFKIMGKTQKGLEEAVNFCIVNASKGKEIKKDSDQMKEMVAYIKSLGMAKKEKKPAPGY
jgi:cytochrome c